MLYALWWKKRIQQISSIVRDADEQLVISLTNVCESFGRRMSVIHWAGVQRKETTELMSN
jgi:hypothetical protein